MESFCHQAEIKGAHAGLFRVGKFPKEQAVMDKAKGSTARGLIERCTMHHFTDGQTIRKQSGVNDDRRGGVMELKASLCDPL